VKLGCQSSPPLLCTPDFSFAGTDTPSIRDENVPS
jgi:hypothetical protein